MQNSVMLAPGAAKLDLLHQSQEVRATKKVVGFGQHAAT
jgi:hypothetical protein